DANGLASVSFSLDSALVSAGTNPYTVNFYGDDMHLPCQGTGTITALYASVLNVTDAAGEQGQILLLRALLRRRPDAAVVPGETLTFQVDGQVIGTATTDSKGLASLRWTVPFNLPEGSKTLTVLF